MRKDSVACVYMVDENTPAGTCACCNVDTESTDLKAANNYKVDHLKEHNAVLETAKVVYSAGFFTTVSPDSKELASSHCNRKRQTKQ